MLAAIVRSVSGATTVMGGVSGSGLVVSGSPFSGVLGVALLTVALLWSLVLLALLISEWKSLRSSGGSKK